MTAYPNAEDYVRAVQHPERVFGLPVLRRAVFEVHPLFGIPMPASGNAAVVFKAALDGADTALRFFIREDAASRERYSALGRHFADRGIDDCVAHPTWLDGAVSVNGGTWPVVQMSWVDGRTLDAYVGHLAGAANAGALYSLARSWRELVARLQAAEFAHGDLQHGNVLIDTSSTLRLVDFDGSWVAAFRGEPPPNETGHPNYQRTGREWGRWMDTFPGLVVYTALLALARQPEWWAQLHNGENMVFSAEDFDPPFRTRTWQLLHDLRDPEVLLATERLKQACDPAWRASGTLEALLGSRPQVEVLEPRQQATAAPFPGIGVPGGPVRWWEPAAVTASGPPPPQQTAPPQRVAQSQGAQSQTAAAPPVTGSAMPPPPPKTAPAARSQLTVPFATSRPTTAWYAQSAPPGVPSSSAGQQPSPRPGRKRGKPSRRHRSVGSTAVRVLTIAGLAGVLMGAAAGGDAGNRLAAAFVTALIAAGFALLVLRRIK
jgi:hypothetical protein